MIWMRCTESFKTRLKEFKFDCGKPIQKLWTRGAIVRLYIIKVIDAFLHSAWTLVDFPSVVAVHLTWLV